jgi:hypothetical protein
VKYNMEGMVREDMKKVRKNGSVVRSIVGEDCRSVYLSVINPFLTLYKLEASFHLRRRGMRKQAMVRGISTRVKG